MEAWEIGVDEDSRALNIKLSKKELDAVNLKAIEKSNTDNSKSILVHEIVEKRKLVNQKKDNKNPFKSENETFKIITSKEQYNTFDFDVFIPDIIFVVPELLWENDLVNEGYAIARELITVTLKSKFFQLVFLSVMERSALANAVDTRNRSFVEAFPHFCLLDNKPKIKFKYYSVVHFNMIKQLAISDHGRLLKIGHEMNSVNTNILSDNVEIEHLKAQMQKELEELTLYQAWISNEISIPGLIYKISRTNDKTELEKIGREISSVISIISLKLPKDSSEKSIELKQKEKYKIFIIEDEIAYRDYISNVLSSFYNNVFPNKDNKYLSDKGEENFDIGNALKIIVTNAKDYQIFLLDLLYKDKDGNWLNFNGLDLFKLIIDENRYAVIRIITSLPRGIVAKVVASIMENTSKPNTDQVFTKKYGYEYLKDSIIDSIDNINEECLKNAKLKNVWTSFPKDGVFKWPGVENLMVELLTTGIDDKKYSDIVEIVEVLFDSYIKGDLKTHSAKWNRGKIPNTNANSRLSYDEIKIKTYIKEKLVSIMVHRLIVINEALKSNENVIKYPDFLQILTNITNRNKLNDNYFYTSLGFHGSSNDKPVDVNDKSFKLDLINLFPHEYKFVKNVISEKKQQSGSKLSEVDMRVIKKVFAINSVKDNWNHLQLDFRHDSSSLTLNDFISFLNSVEANSKKTFAKQIFDNILDLDLDEVQNSTITDFIYSFLESERF